MRCWLYNKLQGSYLMLRRYFLNETLRSCTNVLESSYPELDQVILAKSFAREAYQSPFGSNPVRCPANVALGIKGSEL